MRPNMQASLYSILVKAGEPGLKAISALEKGRLMADGRAETAAYNTALAEVLEEEADRILLDGGAAPSYEEAISALKFLDRFKPFSGRSLAWRTEEYWRAASAYHKVAFHYLKAFPKMMWPQEVERQGRFYRAITNEAEVYISQYTLKRDKHTVIWRLYDREGDAVGYPLCWGVVSEWNIEGRAEYFTSADGKEVTAILVVRKPDSKSGLAAAACEIVDGRFSRWRVAASPEQAEFIREFALKRPEESMARLGDLIITTGRTCPAPWWKEGELVGPFYRLEVDPKPDRVWDPDQPGERYLQWEKAPQTVLISHPDHYAVEIRVGEGEVIKALEFPGYSYPEPDGGD